MSWAIITLPEVLPDVGPSVAQQIPAFGVPWGPGLGRRYVSWVSMILPLLASLGRRYV